MPLTNQWSVENHFYWQHFIDGKKNEKSSQTNHILLMTTIVNEKATYCLWSVITLALKKSKFWNKHINDFKKTPCVYSATQPGRSIWCDVIYKYRQTSLYKVFLYAISQIWNWKLIYPPREPILLFMVILVFILKFVMCETFFSFPVFRT